jgi:hypothetical protein
MVQTNPVKSTPAEKNEAAAKTAPRQSQAPQSSSVPQDKVTLSPQALAPGKNQNGDRK